MASDFLWREREYEEDHLYGPPRRCPNRNCREAFTPAMVCSACHTPTKPLGHPAESRESKPAGPTEAK